MEVTMGHYTRALTLIIIAVMMVMSAACAAFNTKAAPPAAAPAPFLSQAARSTPQYAAPAATGMASDESASNSAAAGVDRKIVRTGTMALEVADISKSLADIAAVATQLNGYVVASGQHADTGSDPSGSISIRVPADKFDEAQQKLRALAVKVTYENSNSQDVTEQYMDLQAQLKNYQATEAQFLELLKKADNVKDILEVQREISNVRGNIERVKGRIQYLDRTSDMSLIDVSLRKSKPIGESTWDVGGIFKGAVDGLIGFGKVLLAILIWVLVFSPVWIIVLVVIFIIRRKKSGAKPAAQK
jgi:hypothetical protein